MGLLSLILFVRLFIFTYKLINNNIEKKIGMIMSLYFVGLTLLALHFRITQPNYWKSSRIEIIDNLVDGYFNLRKDILRNQSILERRSEFIQNVPQGFAKKINSQKLSSLKIIEKGVEKNYQIYRIEGSEHTEFCKEAESLFLNKIEFITKSFQIENLHDNFVLSSVNYFDTELNSLKHACYGLKLERANSLINSVKDLLKYIPINLNFYFEPQLLVFKSVIKKNSFWKPINFRKNFQLSFYFFDSQFNFPREICLSHLLQASEMEINSYQVTAPHGLFSSIATEEDLNDHVSFYMSPFVRDKFFCLLAKDKRWTNVWVGEVL
jgi:hypothetical protein